MTDITDLQARITAALDRIGAGLEELSPGGGADDSGADSAEVARLTEALEVERTANAQLEERVLTIKKKQDSTVSVLASEVERLGARLAGEEETVARLSKVNAELRANNTALREAIAKGVAEPHLVNKSMMVELEALRTAQQADRAELEAVLGELTALVGDAESGTEGEETANA